MPTTTAQRAASAKYDRANTKQISIKLNTNTDKWIIDHLAKQPNIQGYIKELVRKDMFARAEDEVMEGRLKALMAQGWAKVSYSAADEPSCAFFDVEDDEVARWLVRRFDARQDAITEGTWVVQCGNGESHDKVILPMLDRLLGKE